MLIDFMFVNENVLKFQFLLFNMHGIALQGIVCSMYRFVFAACSMHDAIQCGNANNNKRRASPKPTDAVASQMILI